MHTRKLDWWSPELGGLEADLVREVLESNFLNDGAVTTRFERAVADLLGARHAVAVTSGTTALFLALAALDVGPGDEVLVPDVTFIASANAVTLAGAKPVFVDVDPDRLTMCPDAAAAAVTPRTRAIMPVHVSGRSADMPRLLALAREHDLAVVEDAAEAWLSKAHGKYLGTHGDLGCLSLSPNKTITTGQGGVVLTDSDHLAANLRALKDQGRPVRGTGGNDQHPTIGYNFKFTNLQAAVGLGQLALLRSRCDRLRAMAGEYADGLDGVPGLRLLPFDLAAGEVPQWIDAVVEDRDGLVRFLATHNVFCRPFWFPLHEHTPYRLPADSYPYSTRLIPKAVWLPSAFQLTTADVAAVCSLVRTYLSAGHGSTHARSA